MQLCHCAELLVTKPRLFQRPPGNSRFAGFLPDFEVILVVDIAESPVKRTFRGVPHRPPERSMPLHLLKRCMATLTTTGNVTTESNVEIATNAVG